MTSAPFIGIARHRLLTDGDGVTTLAAFHGCTLRCKYCLNPQSLDNSFPMTMLTPQELYEQVRIDELYFLATGGGVCFGGGEPCLQYKFIKEFRKICGKDWKLTVETALNVPRQNIEELLPVIDFWIVDVKDCNPEIYQAYTGMTNDRLLENLQLLKPKAESVLIRVPLISEFNTEEDQKSSRKLLESMGFTNFEEFNYQTKKL